MYVCMDVWVQKTSQHTARCHTYLSMHQNLLRRRKKWIMSLSSKRRTSILTFRFAGPRDPKRIKNDFFPCSALKSHFCLLVRVSLGELFAAPRGEKCCFDLPGGLLGLPEIQVLEGLSKHAHFDYRNVRFGTFSSRSATELIFITETFGLRHFPPDQLRRRFGGIPGDVQGPKTS